MAQKSIPLMNKVGYSMYWNNMWEDKINYSKNLNNNLFFNEILYLILNNYSSYNYINLNNNIYKNLNKYKIFLFKNLKTKKIKNKINFFLKNNYTSKIWLIKLNNWFIIYSFYINTKTVNININKKKKINFYIFKKNLINFNY